MRRFFKSAAFPILLVVILAFVAQRVISHVPGTEAPSYNELINPKTGLIAEGKIEEVTINTKDNTLDVKQRRTAKSFSTGYPPNTEQSLINLLDENDVETRSTAPAARACSRCSPTSFPSSSSSASGSS